MLEKTMKQVLIKKLNAWIDTIDDKDVKKAIEKDTIVTGGCFTSFLQNEKPNDYDVYFRTQETVIMVANYYAEKWNKRQESRSVVTVKVYDETAENVFDRGRVKLFIKSSGVVGDPEEARASEELGVVKEFDEIEAKAVIEKEKEEFFPVFISSNAITLSNKLQIVVRFYGEPGDIHDTFDFVHTKAFFDYGNKTLDIPKEVYECVINKTLKYTGSRYPVCSVFRIRKFIQRGWTINAGQMLKIAMQMNHLDLMDVNTLEDQLIGVDSLYFMNLINQFRTRKENEPNFELSSNYIISIIDKIF